MPTEFELYQKYLEEKAYGEGGLTPEKVTGAAENAASVMGAPLALGKSAVGKFAAPFVEGGAMGAAQDEEDRLRGFLTGAGTQGGVATAGKILGGVGDAAMQMAVGRKKFTPGVGTELADAGLFGTQNMMRGQTGRALNETGQEMGRVASEIQTPISGRKIGREISEEMTAPLTGSWTVAPSARDTGTINDMMNFAEDVAARGDETATQALARRRAAGSSAYSQKTGDPKLAPLAQASKLEQAKYSQALKEADPRMVPLDTRYAALKKAEKGLSEEPSIPRSLLGIASMTSKSIPGGSLATGAVGQAGVKGDKLAQFLAPLSRQATIADPQSEEEKLYQEYLKSKGR